jgi:hypothetical protein
MLPSPSSGLDRPDEVLSEGDDMMSRSSQSPFLRCDRFAADSPTVLYFKLRCINSSGVYYHCPTLDQLLCDED